MSERERKKAKKGRRLVRVEGSLLEPATEAYATMPPSGAFSTDMSPISPTGITNAVRRPRSARYPAPQAGVTGGFLAAEHFSRNYDRLTRSQSSSPLKRRGRETIGSFRDLVNLDFNCAPGQNSIGLMKQKEQFAIYQPEISAFQPLSKAPRIPGQQNSYVNAEEIREGCVKPAIARTAQMLPEEKQVKAFVQATKERTQEKKSQIQDCATRAIEMYREQCIGGQHRGDDDEFFLNHESNPQAPESPAKGTPRGRPIRRKPREQGESAEVTMRKRSMRYPEAVDMGNSIIVSDTNEEEALEEGESIVDLPVIQTNPEDSPISLRDYRLSLFQNDMDSQVVPRSKYTRALNELQVQDGTVEELHEDLKITKETLATTKALLKEKELIEKKQNAAVTDLRAKFVTEKQALHDRLQREAEQNSKLQTKLSSLTLELARLRTNLRSAKSELKKKSDKWMDESRNEETSKASGRSSNLSAEDTALVAALRSEIADLKEQLEEARLFENRTVDSPEYDSTDVMRLKAQLEAAERELCRLKNAQMTTLSNDVLSEVKDALVKSQEDLKIAREREQYLAMELEKTKAIVATLEQGRRIDHIGSLAEVEGLRERMLVLEKEAEESKLKADYELETFRLEADELRDEIQRLAGALADETRRARFEASERMKERIEFDYKLKCSEDQGKHFEETIRKLEEQLAKSENDSGCGTGSNITPDRQVKRRLERSQAIATSTPAANAAHNEIRKFEQELNEKNEQQSLLQDELDVVNEKLRLAEATVSKTHELANFRARESLARSTRLERGVGTLKTIFEVSSQSDSGRDQHRTELTNLREREKTLENEMLALQSKLNASEARVKHEMFRAEEERRMAIETDAERIAEIDRLKAELRRTKEKMTSHEVTMETGNAPMNYRESQLSPNQDSKKIPSEPRSTENKKDTEVQCNIFHMEADRRAAIESDSERLAEIDRLKEELTRFKEITPDADEIVHAQKLVGMQQHKDAACYDDRDSLILDALHAARKYVNFREQAAASASEESNGQGTPSKSPTRRSKWNPQEGAPSLAWSSDSSSSSFKESGSETTVAVENLKSPSVMDGYPCISSPESMLDDFSGNAVPTPPSSPPRLKFLSSPPSKGTFLSMVDEEKVVSSGVPTSVTTRLDEIQRRLLQSNERLSAAKSKLKDLAATSEVNKSEQMMLKSHVDEILEAIAQQTKRAMQSSPPQPSPPPKATYSSSSSPDRSIRNRDSTSSPSTNSRNIISNTEKVLERYRKYKASQLSSPSSSLENSPNRPVSGRLVDVLDDEAEI